MRRETDVLITAEGRDNGKVFHLIELPAFQAEEWFARALLLLARSGTEVPPGLFALGAAGFVTMGLGAALSGLSKANFFEVKPLMDEMMGCVSYRSPTGVMIADQKLVMTQIEEVATIIRLREEVISLHLGFSIAERLLNFRDRLRQWITENMRTTSTSDDQSATSSQLN